MDINMLSGLAVIIFVAASACLLFGLIFLGNEKMEIAIVLINIGMITFTILFCISVLVSAFMEFTT